MGRKRGESTFSACRALLGFILLGAPAAFGAVQPWFWVSLLVLTLLLLVLWVVASVERGFLRIVWSPLYWPAAFVPMLETADLDPEVREKIAWKNATRAFPRLAC